MALVTREIPFVPAPLIRTPAFHGIPCAVKSAAAGVIGIGARWNAADWIRGNRSFPLVSSHLTAFSMGLCCSLCDSRGPHVWLEPKNTDNQPLLQATQVPSVVRTRLADEMRDSIIIRGHGRSGEYEFMDPVACSLSTARRLVAMAKGTAIAFNLRLVGLRWTADDDTMEKTQGFFELADSTMQYGTLDRILVGERPFDDSEPGADLGLGPAPGGDGFGR